MSAKVVGVNVDFDFVEHFAWAIPAVFANTLGSCRFQRGDLFYDSREGYEVWKDALKHIRFSLQVKSLGTNAGSGTFEENWKAGVVVQVTDYAQNLSRETVTTQGRVYMLLWKGDYRVLDSSDAPPIPVTLMGLPDLEEHLAISIRDRMAIGMHRPNLWVMPFDPTKDIALAKYKAVREAFAKDFNAVERVFSLEDSGVPLFAVPTVSYVCFAIDHGESSRVADTLKQSSGTE